MTPMTETARTPATCHWCEEPMDGRPCIGKPLAETAVVEGVSYYRVPNGPPEGPPANCHECATPPGGLHHPGCDAERCPRCLGQAISCGCRWAGDQPDPDDDGYREFEAPEARRATPPPNAARNGNEENMTEATAGEIVKIADLLNDPELRTDVYGNSSGVTARITHTRSGLSVITPFDEESVRRAAGELRAKVAAADLDERRAT